MPRWTLYHLVLLMALALSGALTGLLVRGLAPGATHPALAALILVLFAITTALLAFAALTALAGLGGAASVAPVTDQAVGRCAVLWLIAGEPPEPIAARVSALLADLDRTGQAAQCDIFILSDTQGDAARAREALALAGLHHRVRYRNRPSPTDRKPGNLQDWVSAYGAAYQTMLVLDADSGFSAARLARMRRRMAADPRLGLLQAAIRLRPTRSRFGQMQRLSARLSGRVFAHGLARLSGTAGNFWGHNALIRTRAFADVTPLAALSGPPPFGGPVLSHDFIEAAYLRRAGWKVVLCADSRGSFEDAPETIAAHLRRDRRWAQGNLQHLRLMFQPGLHPVSRAHLAFGILSYLAAPTWLVLVLLTGSGAVHATSAVIWPLAGVLGLLLVPKLVGLLARPAAFRRRARRNVLLRAVWGELGLSTLFAPVGMVWRSGFVASMLVGRSVDWVPSGRDVAQRLPGRAEALGGVLMIGAVAGPQWAIAGPAPAALASLLVLPLALPLLLAPNLWRWFNADARQNRVARYYDRSTRRFLAVGGSGAALAIHRPLWAEGVTSSSQAAAHINTVIAAQAEAALGHPPLRVVDLGCGVGGTVFHLARRWPQSVFCGITISAEQVRLAEAHAHALNLHPRCTFLRSDFTLPMTLPQADLAIAVESHVHAPNAALFLQAALRHVRPGGVLVLVDDMLAQPETGLAPRQMRRLASFRRGWRLGHVPDRDGLKRAAQSAGFTVAGTFDLTPLLRLNRVRDRVLRVVGPVVDSLGLARLPLFGNMIGGNALTESYRAGDMRYTCLVLQNPADAEDQTCRAEAVA